MRQTVQAGFLVSVVFVWTLATIALVLRFVARRMTDVWLWLDDYFCLVAYFFALVNNAWCIQGYRHGIGLRLEQIIWLPPNIALQNTKRDLFFVELFYGLSAGSSKLAFLGLYWRLFASTTIRWPVMYLAFLALCWIVARTTVGLVQCIPIDAFWDGWVCAVDNRTFTVAAASSHLGLDLIILFTPMFEVYKMRLEFWPKVGMAATFLLGTFICICIVVVLTWSLRDLPSDNDFPLVAQTPVLFENMEVNLAVVTSCLPILRPISKLFSSHGCAARRTRQASPSPGSPSRVAPPPPPNAAGDGGGHGGHPYRTTPFGYNFYIHPRPVDNDPPPLPFSKLRTKLRRRKTEKRDAAGGSGPTARGALAAEEQLCESAIPLPQSASDDDDAAHTATQRAVSASREPARRIARLVDRVVGSRPGEAGPTCAAAQSEESRTTRGPAPAVGDQPEPVAQQGGSFTVAPIMTTTDVAPVDEPPSPQPDGSAHGDRARYSVSPVMTVVDIEPEPAVQRDRSGGPITTVVSVLPAAELPPEPSPAQDSENSVVSIMTMIDIAPEGDQSVRPGGEEADDLCVNEWP